MIKANIHSDDFMMTANFDATKYFEIADDEAILELSLIDFRGDYVADEVAYYLSDFNTDISKVIEYCKLVHTGFEVLVDEEDAMNWLKENNPEIIPS